MVNNTFLLIFSDPKIVFSLCFVCPDPGIKFLHIFEKKYGNTSFHGNQIGHMVPILLVKNVLLTF